MVPCMTADFSLVCRFDLDSYPSSMLDKLYIMTLPHLQKQSS